MYIISEISFNNLNYRLFHEDLILMGIFGNDYFLLH